MHRNRICKGSVRLNPPHIHQVLRLSTGCHLYACRRVENIGEHREKGKRVRTFPSRIEYGA